MMSHWPLSFLVNFIILQVEMNLVVCFVMYKFVLWMSILTYVFVWVFVLYMFVRMTIHILMGFRHVHVCTNDYPHYCVWVFVMHISVQMTIHSFLNGFSSCTRLYEWLPFLCVLVFIMHISVRMTIHFFWIGFRHGHVCTNDYHFFLNGLSSFTFLYEWLQFLFEWIVVIYISVRMTTISFWMDCRHLHKQYT